ncbi:hypothetical protein C8R46DRAFT_1061446 [Mycena filopes]|nr:hypothetical protein C8R46DRAFT_1061446 [Mycena filopes]
MLSQVCSHWHGIAFENPTFWSNIEINCALGSTQSTVEKTTELLSARLERSRDVPLSITLASLPSAYNSQPIHPRLFHLLAQHSHRRETVHVCCSLEGADLSVFQGRLPKLKSLLVGCRVPDSLESFGIAPLLDNLTLGPTLLRAKFLTAILQSRQLKSFGCLARVPDEFREAMSVLPKLPVGAEFLLVTRLPPHWNWSFSLDLPPVTAPISTLGAYTTHEYPQQLCSVLGQILASLTLPQLGKVIFHCRLYPRHVHEWPHTAFLALCQRSNLGRCLKTLRIVDVRVAEGDLPEVLSVLEALEHLEVGDAPGNDEGSNNVLITDTFLRALTWTPGHDCLVPCLSHLTCVSRFAFTHGLLVDLVASRLSRPSTSPILLHLVIYPCPGSAVFLDSTAHTMLQNLTAVPVNRRFAYLSGEDYMSTRRGMY